MDMRRRAVFETRNRDPDGYCPARDFEHRRGCGPAFVAMFMEALADGAVKHGIPRADAYRMVSQMVAGTGKLQLVTGQHPGVMKDAVCSPGGTTIVGVAELEHKGLRGAVIAAVDAVQNKPA